MATSKPPVAPKPGRPQSSVTPSPPAPYVQHSKRKSTLQNSAVTSPPSTPPLSAPPHLRSPQQPIIQNSSIVNGDDDLVPPLPERNQPKQLRNDKPTNENGVLLSSLIDTSSKNLPIPVRVETGLYGNLSQSSLYEEKLIIHFEMRLKVIQTLFERGGTYQIPLCSANKFSLLHNPTDNISQAMMGHYYETVGHILAQPRKPTVVCATRSCTGQAPDSTVQDGDIFILSPNVHTKPFKSGKYLKCINVNTNEEKLLHESCVCGFTTQPEKIKVSLRDLWESKYTRPPLKAIMYHQLPHVVLMKETHVTLLSETWEDSVIATKCASNNSSEESIYGNCHLFRILKDVGISLFPETDQERANDYDSTVKYKTYCEETCRLYNEFDYSRIKQHLFSEDPVWPNYEEVQSSIYTNIHHDNWEQCVQTRKPEGAFKLVKRRKSGKNYSPVLTRKLYENCEPTGNDPGESIENGASSSPHYQVPRSIEGNYSVLHPVSKKEIDAIYVEDQPISDVANLLHEVNTANRQMMIHVDSLRAEVEGLKMELKQTKNIMGNMKRDLTSSIEKLQSEIDDVKGNIGDYYVTMVNTDQPSSETENREILKGLNPEQVIQVLDRLNLVQYKPIFSEKNITGLELFHCSENVLQNDLKVTSRLDCIRLMMLIQGRESIWKLLETTIESS